MPIIFPGQPYQFPTLNSNSNVWINQNNFIEENEVTWINLIVENQNNGNTQPLTNDLLFAVSTKRAEENSTDHQHDC